MEQKLVDPQRRDIVNVLCDRLLFPLPPINPGKNVAEWEERRKKLLSELIDIEYGGLPPKPQSIRVEQLQSDITDLSMKVYINESFNFMMKLFKPKELCEGKKYPVILTGDGCFRYCNSTVINKPRDRTI